MGLWGIPEMIIGFFFQIALLILVVVVFKRFFGKKSTTAVAGHSLRRFFQYVLLYGLLVVGASGLSGLIERLLSRDTAIVISNSDLARNLSFTVVGIPLFALVALWSKRKFKEDPTEEFSYEFRLYMTTAPLTALIVSMVAFNDILRWIVSWHDFNPAATGRFIIWVPIWFFHYRIYVHFAATHRSEPHDILGSLIGLGFSVVGLGGIISGVVSSVFGLRKDEIFAGGKPILSGVATLIVGACAWTIYWIRNTAKSERNQSWLSLVLLAGVGGGLLMAVISASTVLYSLLVWFIGNPASDDALIHFHNLPLGIAFAAVGVLSWWYHREVLAAGGKQARSEVQRIYEYVISAIGLAAAAGGLGMVLVAFIEAISSQKVITADSQTNTLIAALTLLIVGAPIWWAFWHRLQVAVAKWPKEEHASPTRRAYLFLLFGVGGIAAVISLLVVVYLIFDDIFSNVFGLPTLNRMRFSISVLLTTAAVAGYHWMIYREERGQVEAFRHIPNYVLLVGPKDQELVRAIAGRTGGRVENWVRTDDVEGTWPHQAVLEAIDKSQAKEIIVVADDGQVRVIPVDRHHSISK